MKKFSTLLVGLALTVCGWSQTTGYCGTNTMSAKQASELKAFAAAGYPNMGTRGTYYIPIKFHLTAYYDGSGVYSLGTLLELLCELNTKYQPVGFYFYMYGDPEVIRDSTYYNITYTTGDALMSAYNVSNVVNVYVVGDPAGNCGYYTGGNDAVAVGISCSGIGSTTLAHELGHYFSLPHPFINYNVSGRAEYVDGSNCKTAGDYFCDTHADFIDTRWACPYTGTKKDGKGWLYHPDSSLFMSYSLDNCQSRFSKQQTNAMINDLTSNRTWLYSTSLNTSAVDTVSNVSPANLTTGVTAYPVKLTWNKAKNATRYLVQYAVSPSFAGLTHDTIVSDTFLYADKVISKHNYYWRVRGYQPGNTCSSWSSPFKFRTATLTASGTTDLNNQFKLTVYPNPVTGNSFVLNFAHPLGNNLASSLDIIDINGRIVSSNNVVLTQGENIINLPSTISSGTYLLRLHAGSSSFSKMIQVIK